MHPLPEANSSEKYSQIDLKNELFAAAARQLLGDLQLEVGALRFPTSGSSPVVLADDRYVVKFFAPIFEEAFQNEESALRLIQQTKCMAAPTPISSGQHQGWSYLIMSQLKEVDLKQAWPGLEENDRLRICREIGKSVRRLHDVPIDPKNIQRPDWEKFILVQKQNCQERHRKLGLRNDLVEAIPDFLQSVPLRSPTRLSLLHTEVMRVHVFVQTQSPRTTAPGFIDFEPSMIGDPEYEFASIGVFLSGGDPGYFAEVLKGYGDDFATDPAFHLRVMAYLLLHKYSNLKWYLEFMPDADDLNVLAQKWFGRA